MQPVIGIVIPGLNPAKTLCSASSTRFASEDTIMKTHGLDVEIDTLSPAGTASRYEIRWQAEGFVRDGARQSPSMAPSYPWSEVAPIS